MAVCAIFQSAYNLLPLYPLDGGRALRCAAELIFPECTAGIISESVRVLVMFLIWIGAVYAAFGMKLGGVPLIFALILHFRTKIGKIPCKPARLGVQ